MSHMISELQFMSAKTSSLCCTLLLILAACDATPKQHQDAPHSTSSTQAIKIGEAYYVIPRNYFDSPLESDHRSGRFQVVGSILLVGTFPEFNGPTAENASDFRQPGFEPFIRVLASDAPVGADKAVANLKSLYLKGALVQQTLDGGRHLILEKHRNTAQIADVSDFYADSSKEFSVCGKISNPGLNLSCETFVSDGDQVFHLTYASHPERRTEVTRAVFNKFASWRVPSSQDR